MDHLTGVSLSPGKTFNEDKEWTTEEAFQYCGDLTQTRFSGLPFNPRFLSGEIRPHFQNISAFCLFADDFTNSPGYLDNLRPFFIENWESQLLQCIWRKPKNPVFIALRETITRFDFPVRMLQDLLSGYRFSLAKRQFSDMEDLQENFLYSSRALGRLALYILGNKNKDLQTLSDSLCSGIHMAHLWRRVSTDLTRGRIYIPEENRRANNYTDQDLLDRRFNSQFRSLMSGLVAQTRNLLWESRPICERVDSRVRFEVTRIWNAGIRILDRIEEADFNVFDQNPGLLFKDHLIIFFRTALPPLMPKRGPGEYPRKESHERPTE